MFLSDIGNFSFYSDDESNKYRVKHGDKEWTGYWAWCAAINRALDVSDSGTKMSLLLWYPLVYFLTLFLKMQPPPKREAEKIYNTAKLSQ